MKRPAWGLFLQALALPAWAASVNSAFFFESVPTLDEVGLGALIALVAAVGGWAVRRRARRE